MAAEEEDKEEEDSFVLLSRGGRGGGGGKGGRKGKHIQYYIKIHNKLTFLLFHTSKNCFYMISMLSPPFAFAPVSISIKWSVL